MREIKFRGWTKEKGGMFRGPWYGGFSIHATGTIADRELLPTGDIEVEQYTGLRDKNGVDIYEGDVIRCALMFEGTSLPHMGEVAWDDERGCWSTRNLAGLTPFLKHELIAGREVIGNIHEHKELLK